MKAVGIKALKARLSHYLRAVRAGETLLVTDRDEVIAELRPARGRRPPRDDVEERLEALAEAGELTRAGAPKGDWSWKPRGLGLSRRTVERLLEELRSDRGGD